MLIGAGIGMCVAVSELHGLCLGLGVAAVMVMLIAVC